MADFYLRPHPTGTNGCKTVVDEYIWDLSINRQPDDQVGSVLDYGAWAALLRAPLLNHEAARRFKLTLNELTFLLNQAGVIIVKANGPTSYTYYPETEELEEAWAEQVKKVREAIESQDETHEEEDGDCGLLGADPSLSDSYPWHYPDEDCRSIRLPLSEAEYERIEQIDYLLDRLRRYWHSHPQLRLGQIVVNLSGTTEAAPEIFYLQDDRLLRALETAE